VRLPLISYSYRANDFHQIDSNTFVNPTHRAEIDDVGNILIWRAENKIVPSVSTATPETLDPIIVQLVEAALQNTRNEMDTLIQRVSMSPAIREQLDYFPMIAAGEGKHSGKMVCGQVYTWLCVPL